MASLESKVDFPGYPPGSNTWTGRRPKGEKCHDSFASFVAASKNNKNGQAHLKRHHNGYGL